MSHQTANGVHAYSDGGGSMRNLWVLALIGCSAEPSSSSQTIGPEGGVLELGGMTLTVPRGALAAPKELSVQTVTTGLGADMTLYSPVYRFAPRGLLFRRPCTLAIHVDGKPDHPAIFASTLSE